MKDSKLACYSTRGSKVCYVLFWFNIPQTVPRSRADPVKSHSMNYSQTSHFKSRIVCKNYTPLGCASVFLFFKEYFMFCHQFKICSWTLSVCALPWVRYQLSQPDKTTDKITVSHILTSKCLDRWHENNRFWTKCQKQFRELKMLLIISQINFDRSQIFKICHVLKGFIS
jgi:hypothetical protein